MFYSPTGLRKRPTWQMAQVRSSLVHSANGVSNTKWCQFHVVVFPWGSGQLSFCRYSFERCSKHLDFSRSHEPRTNAWRSEEKPKSPRSSYFSERLRPTKVEWESECLSFVRSQCVFLLVATCHPFCAFRARARKKNRVHSKWEINSYWLGPRATTSNESMSVCWVCVAFPLSGVRNITFFSRSHERRTKAWRSEEKNYISQLLSYFQERCRFQSLCFKPHGSSNFVQKYCRHPTFRKKKKKGEFLFPTPALNRIE